MQGICDRCGKHTTKTKKIKSKKTGKEYEMFECVHGCTDGKWAYSFFPPRENKQAQAQNGEALTVLKDIRDLLKKLVEKNGTLTVTSDELQPDEETPF